MTPAPSSHRRPSPAAIFIIIPLAVALVLSLFAWPQARLEPRGVPVGVAGQAGPFEQRLAAQGDAFEIERYGDEAAAREAIEDREVYGAFVAGPSGPKVLIASAASPAISQALSHAALDAGAPVEDVVAARPAGGGLAASILPLVLAGILTGVLSTVLVTGAWKRTGLLVTGSALAGLTATAIVQGWLEVVGGDWLANAGVLSLTVLAIAATVAGFEALMGGNLLRSTGFFDGAAVGGHVAVLAAWVLLGLGALFVAGLRGRRAATAAVPVPA